MDAKSLRNLLEENGNFKNAKLFDVYEASISELIELIGNFLTDEDKLKLYNYSYFEKFNTWSKEDIIEFVSYKEAIQQMLKEDIIDILSSLDFETLKKFLDNFKEFLDIRNIHIYEISMKLNYEKQKQFAEHLDELNLTLTEKKEILATLSQDVKKDINSDVLTEEYKIAISMETSEIDGVITIDLNRDLEEYDGFDNLIRIKPQGFTEEQRKKLIKLCEICPNLKVVEDVSKGISYFSTGNEYKQAEEWIESLINSLDPNYTKAQKLAIIDNQIGKIISYSPDIDTEVFNNNNARSIWKIICSGYGICSGVAELEKYILSRIGIESEIITSRDHAFLKIKDIKLPLANGEIVKGNTILDPTWNLAAHRFGGKPDNFCISYEEARNNDISLTGDDLECHKNDEALQDATLSLDDKSLRRLFASVGLTQESGEFPLVNIANASALVDAMYSKNTNANINVQLLYLAHICPEFATCQNSTMQVLRDVFFNNQNLKFDRCLTNRVYARDDTQKRTVLYIYTNSHESGENFYVADKDKGQFFQLSKEEFEKRFECYEMDLENTKRN